MFLVFLSLAFAKQPLQDSPALKQPANNPKRYQVTLRVIRPTWRRTPTAEEIKRGRGKYGHILSGILHPKDLSSDTELLQKLNKNNPEFKFDRFLNKASFILSADTVWTAPQNFSLNDFHLALIQNRVELMDVTAPVRGTIVTMGKSGSAPQSQLPQYSKHYPPNVRQQIEADGKVILTSVAVLKSLVDGKNREYARLFGGAYIIEKNAATCIIYKLDVYWMNDKVVFNPSDVVILTVSDAK